MGKKDNEKMLEGIRRKCRWYQFTHSCMCCSTLMLFRSEEDKDKAIANARQEGGYGFWIKDALKQEHFVSETYWVEDLGKYKAGKVPN